MFQAVITVNLTSMLVLTTMFINVSNNLPKTSYMKMMDVWLLFNLLYPFIIVLLHTYMDTLRTDDEDGKTIEKIEMTVEVNFRKVLKVWKLFLNKGMKVSTPTNQLISINEREEKDAQQKFYNRVQEEMSKKKKKSLKFVQKVTIVYSPSFVLIFMMVYWIAGLKHAGII